MYAILQIYNWSVSLKLEIWNDLSLSNCRTFFPYPNGDSIKYIKGIAIPVVEFHIQGCKIQQTLGWKWRIPWYILKLIDELCSKKAGVHISMFLNSNALTYGNWRNQNLGGCFGAKQHCKSSPFTMELVQMSSTGSAF